MQPRAKLLLLICTHFDITTDALAKENLSKKLAPGPVKYIGLEDRPLPLLNTIIELKTQQLQAMQETIETLKQIIEAQKTIITTKDQQLTMVTTEMALLKKELAEALRKNWKIIR